MLYRLYVSISLFLFTGLFHGAYAQHKVDTLPAEIAVTQDDNKTSLKALLRPLRQIAGAPEAFYTYFWEFGDGAFSFDKDPVHVYKDTGDYELRLWATNNYDDGRPPTSKPRRVKVKTKAAVASAEPSSGFFKKGGVVEMKINRMPKPGEEMVAVIGYRNPMESGVQKASGSLLVFYNDKQFKKDNFELAEARAYNKERKTGMDSLLAMLPGDEITPEEVYAMNGPAANIAIDPARKTAFSGMLMQTQSLFREQQAWRFEDLQKGEEKFIFLSLQTTPDMIKDTNAMVTITTIFVPDDISLPLEKFDMEMQIVASHDPNRMQLRNRRMNYRFVSKSKELTYKVQFQNTGKGPASKVLIGVAVPDRLNASSLEIVDYAPKCVMCDSAYERQSCLDTIVRKDSIFFVFNNIYLPGVQQDGVKDTDSTKGFVRYRVRFQKDLKKLPFQSQASIVFDKNEPVITNRSTGRWAPGISPVVIAGYGIGYPADTSRGPRDLVIGFGLSPYSPYRIYLQPEIYFNFREKYETLKEVSRVGRDTAIGQNKYVIRGRERYEVKTAMLFDVVPIHVRYNINRFVGVGLGSLFSVTAFSKTYNRRVIHLTETGVNEPKNVSLETKDGAVHKNFQAFNGALFADLNLGMARVGPSLGVRYLHYLEEPHSRLFLYGTWRF
ncbi:PKD domain-containing protein [uncultured Chitinophaga sp.]|uniref:PKD domain-containing protein n=1 Tax=uncultured Chitinophaga sp. TaxID=339340 RepID=UPI0025D4C413|nr:PKD domain-containing protein [uncultured Chitinophaga sp.]